MADILTRLQNPPFGTETSERNLMQAAADEIKGIRTELTKAEERAMYWQLCHDKLAAENAQMRTALKYGRDCVMESFEHVKDTDDQVMADARLQAIDAALGTIL